MEGVVSEKSRTPVAFLEVCSRASEEEPFSETNQHIPVFPSDDFFFGRSPSCEFVGGDSFVSNKHLHFHCIIFEEDDAAGIPPLVYAEDLSTNGTYLTRVNSDQQAPVEQRISRRNGSILLSHGDQLRISPFLCLRFRSAIQSEKPHGLTKHQRREVELFEDRYTITDRIVGSGGHGEVFVAIHKKSGRQLACKVVDVYPKDEPVQPRKPLTDVTNTRDGSPSRRPKEQHCHDGILKSAKFREFDVLKDLDHPNIVHLEKVFWSSENIYIFQELVTGGDLFSYIEFKGGKVPDTDAAVILIQVLKGVEHLHDRDIVHRDLKPDNILITSTGIGGRVIITDFGNARRVSETEEALNALQAAKRRMFTIVGTLEYAAPEIHKRNPFLDRKQGYSKAVDMWSIGVVATALLAGDVIFTDRTNPMMRHNPARVILSLSAECDLRVLDDPNSAWRNVGKRPKDFVKKLLVLDESHRLDVKQAIAHEWFTSKHYAKELNAVYQRSVKDWEPRRKIFRLIEALDQSRHKKPLNQREYKQATRPQFFAPFSVPFPQGDLYPDGQFLAKPSPGMLPRIDEENTPEPETPTRTIPEIPLLPKTKKPGRFPNALEVQYGLSQLDLDMEMTPFEATADIQMTDPDNVVEQLSAEYDIDGDASVQEPKAQSQVVSDYVAVSETPPNARKRPHSPSPQEGDTYDDTFCSVSQSFEEFVHMTCSKRSRVC